jgi:hypothetical protein
MCFYDMNFYDMIFCIHQLSCFKFNTQNETCKKFQIQIGVHAR